jgi:hypothetical protein
MKFTFLLGGIMRQFTFSVALILLAVVGFVSCGGSSSTPSAPSTPVIATQSIAVTMLSPIAVGNTAQATAVATLSNGSTQALTTGFRSDVPTVATVTDSGLVTSVSAGGANIYVVSGGQQGTKNIRVVPNFAGSWSGSYYVTGCSQTGFYATLNYCSSNFSNNKVFPYNMSLTQTLDTVSGATFLGTLSFGQSSGTVDGGGNIALSGNYYSGSSSIYCSWNLSSSTPGRLAGTVQQTWRDSGVSGQMIITGTIRDSMKTNNAMPTTDTRFEDIVRQWQQLVRQ